jgi:hypothetical protein
LGEIEITLQQTRLKNVSDAGVDVLDNPCDFKDYANQTIEYEYNANGAMVKDLSKGITEIKYNHLNLPEQVTISSPLTEATNEYTYTAIGTKLKVIHRMSPVRQSTPIKGIVSVQSPTPETKTTDYVGNKIYENGVLSKILTDNGYFDYVANKDYFYIRDHLENNLTPVDKIFYCIFATQMQQSIRKSV